eukprot:TRINITY_DN1607_c0_g1_i1.p1 TRINITY_DN1607_c0_g1~~TRINITY_DN1607_c0_g1_i1.p1  ORF type:complete len:212 (+),score=35.33 TRINITY_DN1607_c0_g1_i1:120-755(+)
MKNDWVVKNAQFRNLLINIPLLLLLVLHPVGGSCVVDSECDSVVNNITIPGLCCKIKTNLASYSYCTDIKKPLCCGCTSTKDPVCVACTTDHICRLYSNSIVPPLCLLDFQPDNDTHNDFVDTIEDETNFSPSAENYEHDGDTKLFGILVGSFLVLCIFLSIGYYIFYHRYIVVNDEDSINFSDNSEFASSKDENSFCSRTDSNSVNSLYT